MLCLLLILRATNMKQLFIVIAGVLLFMMLTGAILPLLISTDKLPVMVILLVGGSLTFTIGALVIFVIDKFNPPKKRKKK